MTQRSGDDSHPHGLEHDLASLARQLQERQLKERRQALLWLAAGGAAAALAACGGGSDTTGDTVTTDAASTTSTVSSSSDTTTGAATCIADPQETNGPFPADGSNQANGSVSDILTASGIVRSNIRSSFGTSTTLAEGVPLVLTLNLVNVATSCANLADYAIYIWHCNCAGEYSLYASDLTKENYLRGVQVTDDNGQVTFETLFPACYSGRYPHIHFEIYRSLSVATVYTNAILTAQMAMPSAICTAVYEGSTLYSSSGAEFAQVSTSSDMVFASSTTVELQAQTPALTGSVADGFTGTITIGVAT